MLIFSVRLISAFSNKLNPGEPYYQHRYGKYIISRYRQNASRESLVTGNDVTFPEFIKYIVAPRSMDDEHWRPQHLLSFPCYINYTFIGKFETLHEDMAYLLQKLFGLKDATYVQVMNKVKTTDHAVGDAIFALFEF